MERSAGGHSASTPSLALASPSDEERRRFGFLSKHRPGQPTASRDGKRPQTPEIHRAISGDDNSIELVALLEQFLGHPDDILPLLKARSSAHKFDFKGRITDLTEHNRALRTALSEKREGHRTLAEALCHIQRDMNWKLRAVAGEATQAKQQLTERGQIAELLQEAVRTVWREEVACHVGASTPRSQASSGSPAATALAAGSVPGSLGQGQPGSGLPPLPEAGLSSSCSSSRAAALEDQMSALRQCCAAEAGRAALAEALAKQREEEVNALRQEIEELRKSSFRAHDQARRATQLVREAGEVLNEQLTDSKEQLMLALGREQSLTEQLKQAQDRAERLEKQLVKKQHAMPVSKGLRVASPGGA